MFGKVCGWFQSAVSKGLALGAVAVTLMSVTAVDLLAQGAATVNVTPPNIDWGSTSADLISSLTSTAVVGIALSVWALIMVVNLFRRTSSGH